LDIGKQKREYAFGQCGCGNAIVSRDEMPGELGVLADDAGLERLELRGWLETHLREVAAILLKRC
jgi:hypothetical protein